MTAGAGATVRTVLDTGGGLVRRQVEVPAGARHAGSAGPGGELCFVIEGAGQLGSAAAPGRPVRPGTGVWLPPGTSYSLAAAGPGPLRLDSVLLPAPRPAQSRTARGRTARGRTARALTALPRRRSAELAAAGGGVDRGPPVPGGVGARRGRRGGHPVRWRGVPTGRAPVHSHTYDEVVLILAGTGIAHVSGAQHPVAPGTCVYLAARPAALPGEHRPRHAAGARRVPARRQPRRQETGPRLTAGVGNCSIRPPGCFCLAPALSSACRAGGNPSARCALLLDGARLGLATVAGVVLPSAGTLARYCGPGACRSSSELTLAQRLRCAAPMAPWWLRREAGSYDRTVWCPGDEAAAADPRGFRERLAALGRS